MANNNNTKNLNVPNLRFPEFTGEWKAKHLSELVRDIKDRISASSLSIDNYVSTENILQNFQGVTLATSLPCNTNVTAFRKDDILFSNIRPYLKKIWYASHDGGCSTDVFVLRSNSICSAMFLYHLVANDKFINYVMLGTKGTKMPRGDKQQIFQYAIYLPSRLEQNKIATFFSLLDSRIKIQGKIIEKYESLIKGLSESLFSHKLGYVGFKQNWDMKYGNEIFENVSDKNHTSNLPILAITQEHGAIPRDLIDYKVAVTDKSVESYKVVQIGDFIISLRSFQGGIEYSNYKGICSPAYIILRPIIPINNIFYKYYLKTSNYIVELNRNLEGIRDGKMISYKQFSEILLPYPDIAEQNKIADILLVINKKSEIEKLLIKKYREQKKYLLSNLFI